MDRSITEETKTPLPKEGRRQGRGQSTHSKTESGEEAKYRSLQLGSAHRLVLWSFILSFIQRAASNSGVASKRQGF